MRKLFFSLSVMLLVTIVARAQAPAFFNYQGVARNSVGNALVNKIIKLRLTIHDGGALGPTVYSETRTVITNAFGLFSVQVGGGGATNVVGSISGSNWGVGTKWMQVEIDPEGGNTLKDIGTTQLTSVPYSLYTSQSGDLVLPFNKSQNEEVPLFRIINTGNNASSLAFEGLSSSTANNATALRGIITSPSPGVFSAGVIGQNNGTTGNGVGVYGTQNGTGFGVYGTTPGGVGIYGNSTTGMGIYGQSVSGPSIMGYQPSTGTSNAGFFQNFSTTNNATVLRVLSNGAGEGFGVNMTGFGKAGVFTINNTASSNNVLEASTNGMGKAALLQNTGTLNASNILDVSSNGIGRTTQFQNTNAANTAPNGSFLSNGVGENLQSLMTGTGKAGVFSISNTANTSNVLDVSTNGLGRAGYFQNTGALNNSNVFEVITNGMGKTGVLQNTNPANTSNVFDVSTNGMGKTGVLQNTNAANASNVLDVSTNGLGRSGLFQNTNAANASANLSSMSNGAGDGLQSLMTGLGKAGVFNINNATNTSFTIDAGSNGTNNVINSVSTGTGRAGFFQVNNAASTADALSAVTNGTGASWAIRGTSTGTNGAGLFIQSNAANTANNLQSNQAGLGRAAFFNATNAANTANALEVNMAGTGFAASFTNTNAIPKALRTAGSVSFTGISEGPGRVMATVDGSGNATWQNAASVGLVSGSGTTNYVPKWTPDGTALGNSEIFIDGVNVGVGTTTAASKLFVNGDFTAATNTANFVGVFENTNTGDGDGIKIKLGKTHPLWNGTAYKQVDLAALIAPFQPQIDVVQNWVTTNHSPSSDEIIDLVESSATLLAGTLCQLTNFLSDQLNTRLGLPYDLSVPLNSGLGLPKDLSAPINDALNLPFDLADTINVALGLPVQFSFLWIIDQACDICVPDGDIAGSYFDLVPKIPSLEIPGIPNTFNIPSIPPLILDAIPEINCSGLPTLQIPNMDLTNVVNTLTKNNNYLLFADKDDRQVGAIRSQSITDWKDSYLSPTYFFALAGSMAGLDLSSAFGKAAAALFATAGAYNKIGVEYVSGNGDYAEWLERTDMDEVISEGDIVGVRGGKISKDLKGAEQIMAVSYKPIVLGNMPAKEKEIMGNMVAFMGQIPVKVMGPVVAGDYIVAKGEFPGMGTAVHPDAMSVEDFKLVVGRSWDTKLTHGAKMVNTVVGVHNNEFLKFVAELQQKAQTTDQRLKAIEEKLNIVPANNNNSSGNQPKKGFK